MCCLCKSCSGSTLSHSQVLHQAPARSLHILINDEVLMGTLTPAQPAGHGHRSRRCAGGIDFQSWQEGTGLQAINAQPGGWPPNVSINALLSTTQRLSFQWDRGWMPMGLLPGTSGTRGDTQLRPCLSPVQITAQQGWGDRDRTALGRGSRVQSTGVCRGDS